MTGVEAANDMDLDFDDDEVWVLSACLNSVVTVMARINPAGPLQTSQTSDYVTLNRRTPSTDISSGGPRIGLNPLPKVDLFFFAALERGV